MGIIENLLTTTAIFVQSASFKYQFRAPVVQMKSVKGDYVPTLSLLKRNVKNPMNEFLLLVSYVGTSIRLKQGSRQC